jgi:integrase
MPEHMKRREAVYYFRRVIPKDLQASGWPREVCRSLKTSDFGEAKRRLHIEEVRFDEWVHSEREKLAKSRQTVPANENARPSREADDMFLRSIESDEHFRELYPNDDDNGLPYDQWLVERERLDREADAAFLAEERRNAGLPLLDLFDQYAAQPGTRRETERQFRSIIKHLISFLGHDNALRVRRADIVKWRDHLRAEALPNGKPRSAKTINDSYLSAVRTVFAFAMDQLLLSDNPATGVKPLPRGKQPILRERDFTAAEQQMILSATLAAPPPRMSAHKAAARRWVPWLCAYTGARVNEMTQLRAEDVKQVEGVWTVHITPEAGTVKTGVARTVPLHDHLIEQGFLDFVKGGVGPLFYSPDGRRSEAGRAPYKLVGNKLAEWVRKLGLGAGVAPNHGWRHTFKTISREVAMPEAAADYIQGHANKSQGRKYGRHNLLTVKAELDKIPRFNAG